MGSTLTLPLPASGFGPENERTRPILPHPHRKVLRPNPGPRGLRLPFAHRLLTERLVLGKLDFQSYDYRLHHNHGSIPQFI